MTTIHLGPVLHALGPDRVEFWPEGYLAVQPDGRIRAAGDAHGLRPSDRSGAQIRDWSGRLLVPGLVDAHLHLPQIDVIGVASESLLEWLNHQVFPAEIENEDPEVARDRAVRTFDALLANGTTACAAYSSSHTRATEIALEEAGRRGLRATIGKVLMDRGAPEPLLEPATSAIADTERLIRTHHGDPRLRVAITPRFALSCSPELLEAAGGLAAKTGAPVQTHLAENSTEVEGVAAAFPDRADYTDVYDRAGLLTPGALLGHCIHLSGSEWQRLTEREAVAVHCPDSNFYLHSGRFPIEACDAHGTRLALGTDVAAGTTHSIWHTCQMANYQQSAAWDPIRLFYLATLGGAQALGLGASVGNFVPGKEADFALFESPPRTPDADPRHLVSRLIHSGRSLLAERVFIRGEEVFARTH